uniref:amylo-alpha-1,6-glucosidase n=1 Tax=Streptomyces sp. SM14 TaxID=1736045 RepID=UPI000CD52650
MNSTHHRLLVHNGTFATIGPSGDITGARGDTPDGLFAGDARHLSRWQLTIDGTTPTVLVPASEGPRSESVLIPAGSRAEPPAHTVFREQTIADGALVETLRITGNRHHAGAALVAITADADFADQFELRSDHRWYEKPHAVRSRHVLPDGIEFGYRRQEWHSRTLITASPPPDAVEETGSGARRLVWRISPEPQAAAELTLRVVPLPHGAPEPASGDDGFLPHAGRAGADGPAAVPPRDALAADALTATDALTTDALATEVLTTGLLATDVLTAPGAGTNGSWPELDAACRRGLADLAALRTTATGPDGEVLRVPAAGVPWFVTLLGRNALLTSLFALPYRPALAADTLLALAAAQATADEPARIAQPGKIVHEMRQGELAHFGQVPYGRYYGSVDSTPLFLVLLGAHAEHAADDKLARRLERHARAAVSWMFEHGGLRDHGYLVYHPDQGGVANQSWKDSADAICHADGTPAQGRVSAAVAQGYAYDALRRTAGLARTVWDDPAYADGLDAAATALRERFREDFWMDEHDLTALALDGDGSRVDALASDAGHLLWSGILDGDLAVRAGRRLLRGDFFSGWGVRTLAAGQGAYHPLAYHRGAVWPHDNAVLALGLARHGLTEEARTVAEAVVATAAAGNGRLPEVIAGYAREGHARPVPHPHACAPQSWAAAAPFALLTAVATRAGV